jgi:hypothetical protein
MRLNTFAATFAVVAACAAPAMAEDLVFSLINNSTANLQEFYVSAAEADTWGDDILGMDVLAAGENGDVTIADGMDTCTYDMRFVMDNGNTIEGSADLCTTNEFTITD